MKLKRIKNRQQWLPQAVSNKAQTRQYMIKSTIRIVIKFSLLIGLILSIALLIHSINIKEWNTKAASLAVITAIIASWSSQKIIWKQEDDLKPNLIVDLDLKSRKGVTQLIIKNVGGSTAYDVTIDWIIPLMNSKGELIKFQKNPAINSDIPIIHKDQKYACIVGGTVNLYEYYDSNNKRLDFNGVIAYKETKKQRSVIKSPFFISLEQYRLSLDFEDEKTNFYYHGAKIKDELKAINKTLALMQKGLQDKKEEN